MAKTKDKDFEVTEKMFIGAINSLFDKKKQDVLSSFFNVKKDGGNKCQLKK